MSHTTWPQTQGAAEQQHEPGPRPEATMLKSLALSCDDKTWGDKCENDMIRFAFSKGHSAKAQLRSWKGKEVWTLRIHVSHAGGLDMEMAGKARKNKLRGY